MMDDPIYIEKLQAMKRYRKTSTSIGLLSRVFQYFLSALAVGILLSRLCSSLMFLFSMPKYLFIVCNIIIIIFLAGDSYKLSTASPAPDIYEEYAKRNESTEMANVESHMVEDMDEDDHEEDEGDHEEMDKRFDEFIARVIMQRRNEARMLLFHEPMNIMQ